MCSKKFKLKRRLQNHILRHKAAVDRKHKCSECEKSFITGGDLRQHLLSHTGHKPYKCRTCGEFLRYRAQVAAHKKAHKKDRACQFTFDEMA